MRLIPVSICHYIVSRIDPKKPHTAGKKYKPDIAIACKDVMKSWAKRLMKNISNLQIEIYGVKRVTRYSRYPSYSCFIGILSLNSVLRDGAECYITLMNNGSNGDEDVS